MERHQETPGINKRPVPPGMRDNRSKGSCKAECEKKEKKKKKERKENDRSDAI